MSDHVKIIRDKNFTPINLDLCPDSIGAGRFQREGKLKGGLYGIRYSVFLTQRMKVCEASALPIKSDKVGVGSHDRLEGYRFACRGIPYLKVNRLELPGWYFIGRHFQGKSVVPHLFLIGYRWGRPAALTTNTECIV